jgi:hypothetical protein
VQPYLVKKPGLNPLKEEATLSTGERFLLFWALYPTGVPIDEPPQGDEIAGIP